MATDEGAKPAEILIEACRRNNPSLLHSIFTSNLHSHPQAIAKFLNTATDPLGSSALHIAALNGSYEVLDVLLDQEGVEIDGTERREGDTCLHKAVRFVNSTGKEEWERAAGVVDILVDAGCDPRIRNKAKLRPIDLVDPRNKVVRDMLQKADMALSMGGDVVVEDEDEGKVGAGSESD